jgi:hypothetical protein
MEKAKLVVMPRMFSQEMIFIVKAEAHRQCLQYLAPHTKTLPVEPVHESTELGERMFWDPLIGLCQILLAADVVTFLFLVSRGRELSPPQD